MLEFTIHDMQVSAANAAGMHMQQNLVRTGRGEGDISQF
jgi:hypothetical protein